MHAEPLSSDDRKASHPFGNDQGRLGHAVWNDTVEKTMPELLSEQGYVTAMYGKWHLGDTTGRFPTDQGFDEWYVITNTTDEAQYSSQFQYDSEVGIKPFIQQAKRGEEPKTVKPYDLVARRHIDAELTRRAIDFIERQAKADKPFFAFIPLTQVHEKLLLLIPRFEIRFFGGQSRHEMSP